MARMKLPMVNSTYGAPMGRENNVTEPQFPVKFRLQQCRWVDDAYDEGGAYWGMGEPIFWARGDGEKEVQEIFVRARNRKAAKEIILMEFPNAKFYR